MKPKVKPRARDSSEANCKCASSSVIVQHFRTHLSEYFSRLSHIAYGEEFGMTWKSFVKNSLKNSICLDQSMDGDCTRVCNTSSTLCEEMDFSDDYLNGKILTDEFALTLVYQMRMTGFAVVVVVDCLHDLILFMQHNIIIMMMILYKPQSSIHARNKLCG